MPMSEGQAVTNRSQSVGLSTRWRLDALRRALDGLESDRFVGLECVVPSESSITYPRSARLASVEEPVAQIACVCACGRA